MADYGQISDSENPDFGTMPAGRSTRLQKGDMSFCRTSGNHNPNCSTNPNRHSNGNIFYAHFVDTDKKVVTP